MILNALDNMAGMFTRDAACHPFKLPTGRWRIPFRSRPSNSRSSFHKMPTEMVLEIVNHLSLVDQLALALSCTKLFNIVFRHAIEELLLPPPDTSRKEVVENLLIRLEKDLGSTYYFCPLCSKLHTFYPVPSPADPRIGFMKPLHKCWKDMEHRPAHSCHRLGYHHGRLVMNRHFHGPQAGLPITWINATAPHGYGSRYKPGDWTITYAGKIVQDELVLRITRVLKARDVEGLYTILKNGIHNVCPHIFTDPDTPGSTFEGLGLCDKIQFTGQILSGFCNKCLTDYTVEFEKTPSWCRQKRCSMVLQSYHIVGDFRDPQDWKWRAFISDLSRRLYTRFDEVRDTKTYPPGLAFSRWQEQS